MAGRVLTVGITVGDPAGIGPEVVMKALRNLCGSLPDSVEFRLFGPAAVLDWIVGGVSSVQGPPVPRVEKAATAVAPGGICQGRYTAASGAASLAALDTAAAQLASGGIDSLVTGPISKLAFTDAGLDWPGQTEFIADALGCTEFAMMLGGPRLKVALVTTHVAVRDVAAAITTRAVLSKLRICHGFLSEVLGRVAPRIAVTGLNPHCGDGGRFGDEEATVIAPAVATARGCGIDAIGPLAADTVFAAAYAGDFDMVLAMYHDQGLAPLKLVHFADAINVTMGLPRIRCSPDHGPAWDIAGKGVADPSSMVGAILFASGLKRD